MTFDWKSNYRAALDYKDTHDLSPIALCPPTHNCGHPGKVPHTENWTYACTDQLSEEELEADFTRLKGNIGIAQGLASGTCVLDIDDPKAWRYFQEQHVEHTGHLYAGIRTRSGGGERYHLWFTFDASFDTQLIYLDGHKYELHGTGRHAVVPPSIHGKTGNPYAWVVPFDRERLIPIPDWFYEAAIASHTQLSESVGSSASFDIGQDPNPIIDEFNRSDAHFDMLREAGWTHSWTKGDFQAWARPGKGAGVSATYNLKQRTFLVYSTDENVKPFRTYQPKRRYTPYWNFTILAALKFDEDFAATKDYLDPEPPPLPEHAQERVEIAADAIETDERATDPQIEVEMASRRVNEPLFDAKRYLYPGSWLQAYTEYVEAGTDAPSQYGLMCGISTLSMGCRDSWIQYGHQQLRPNVWLAVIGPSTLYRKTTAIGIARSVLRHYDPALQYPDELSPEAFIKHMRDQPFGFFHWSEMNNQLEAFEKRSYMRGYRALITDLYDCPPEYVRKTNSDGLMTVERPFLNILTASTQEWLSECLTEGNLKGGFLPRFLWCMADHKTKVHAWPGKPNLRDGQLLADALYEISTTYRHELEITDEARRRYEEYYYDLEAQADAVTEYRGTLGAFYGRLAVYVIKLGLMYQADIGTTNAKASKTHIETQAIDYSIALANYLKQSVLQILGDIATDDSMRLRVNAVKAIRYNPGIKRSELLRTLRCDKKIFDETLATLIDAEQVYVDLAREGKRGPATARYYLPKSDK